MNKYEAKVQAKRDRLLDRATRTKSEANATYTKARTMADAIPFGQPILVGHHSEGRDRNYRKRIDKTYGKAFALSDQADDLARRAEAVGTGGISSDDPEAVAKLREQLAEAEANQDRMKKANACIRRDDRAGLEKMGFSPEQIETLFKPDFAKRVGFASYQLTNNNANIRRIRARIAQLEKMAQRVDREERGNGYTYREDIEDNRAVFLFDTKPTKEVRELMRRNSFLFSPSRSGTASAYVRKLTPVAINTARWLRPQLDQMKIAE
jgi:hypothetical protein